MTKSKDEISQCITEHVDIPVEVENLQDKNMNELKEICKTYCSNWTHCFNDNK